MSCPVCGKNHHGLCHRCAHAQDVADGKYCEMEFAKTPCFGCREYAMASETKGASRRHAAGHPDAVGDDANDLVCFHELENVLEADSEAQAIVARNIILHILSLLLELDTISREIVIQRLQKKSYSEISGRLSAVFGRTMTVQAVHARLVKLLKSNTVIATLFVGMEMKRERKMKGTQK